MNSQLKTKKEIEKDWMDSVTIALARLNITVYHLDGTLKSVEEILNEIYERVEKVEKVINEGE